MNKDTKPVPPRWIDRFLEWFLPDHLLEDVQGDLHEVFYKQVHQAGLQQARREYLLTALRYIRPYFFTRRHKKTSTYSQALFTHMLGSYLTIAYRNLLRHKAFSAINIIGLAIGMAACLLILQYVLYEWSYDSFHEKGNRIYRVAAAWYYPNGELEEKAVGNFAAAGPAMQKEFPKIEAFARFRPWFGNTIINYQHKSLPQERIYFADPTVFSIFSFPVVKGNALQGLGQLHSVVISQSTAVKYFGEEDPIGKVIELRQGNSRQPFTVRAVFQDIPANAHFKFDVLLSYKDLGEEGENNWGWSVVHTYILLKPQADITFLQTKSKALLQRYRESVMDNAKDEIKFIFQPINDIHLYSDLRDESEPTGNGRMVNFLACIGILILAIAYANYINLATARALDRAKEVGIRKVSGASQGKLIRQFLMESLLLNSIAIILAITLNQLFVNTFNTFAGKSTGFMLGQSYPFFAVLVGCFIMGSILSGAYPAFILSSYQPIAVLKGKLTRQPANNYLRKGLVVFQFATAVVLIAGTLTVHLQVAYMRNQELNVNIDQVLVFKAPIVTDSAYHQKIKVLKENLLTSSSIKQITTSSEVPGRQIYWSFDAIHPKNIRPEQVTSNFILSVDDDFVKTYDLQLVAGRDFNKQLATDKKGLLVNEAAAALMGFASPQAAIDQPMIWEYSADGEGYKIIGVVKNFHQQSLQYAYDPIILINDHTQNRFFSCKVQSRNIGQTIQGVEQVYRQLFPGNPFEYFFLDEFFEQQYQTDRQFGKIFSLFSSLAIFVACLGLVGLVSLITRQRTKEIGVRKVLGASVNNILLLLSKDFIRLILLACFIAWPIAFVGIQQWLSNYAFRIPITLWLLLLPTMIVCVVALLAISLQTIKAARANPVKALRYE